MSEPLEIPSLPKKCWCVKKSWRANSSFVDSCLMRARVKLCVVSLVTLLPRNG